MVRDLGRSLRFYRDALGLKVFKTLTLSGEYPETVLGIKGIRLTYVKLIAPKQSKNGVPFLELHYWLAPKISSKCGYNHISFTVDDIDSEYQRLSRLGVKFISKPMQSSHGKTKLCFAYDPDKNLIELVEDLKKERLWKRG
jgi:catechol 2,3-dioxygenase-like lactoylglutathione lyase family enzyme